MKNKKPNNGFTLVELLVVISLIAILTAIVIAKVSDSRKNAYYLKRLSDINQIDLSLQKYNVVNLGKYPSTSDVWLSSGTCVAQSATVNANFVPGLVPTYISSIPKDPENATNCLNGPMYMYKSNGRNYKLIVYNDKKDVDVLLQKNKNMIDPVRPATSTTPSFGIWLLGGISY